MHADVRVEFDTPLSPDGVAAALTDFSERRPQTWPTLDASKYEVLQLGDTWAVVNEGSVSPAIHARERYDWSDPTDITWTVQESDVFKPGSNIEVRIEPGRSGGSHVGVHAHRISTGARGAAIVLGMKVFGRGVFMKTYKGAFDARAGAGADAGSGA